MPRKAAHGVESGQARHVGIDIGGEARITVAHQFLREALRHARDGELGREGVAQRMEDNLAAQRVDARDVSRRHVQADQAVGVVAASEDGVVVADVRRLSRAQLRQQLGVDREERLAAVFRRAGADDDVRALMVELEIAPDELAEFIAAQTGVGRRQVEQAMRTGDREQLVEFVVAERAALFLPSASVGRRHAFQRIGRDATVALHPVEERVRAVEVFVEGLRPELRLA